MRPAAKLLALFLALLLPLSLCACGKSAPKVYPIAREMETGTTTYTHPDEEDLGPFVYKAIREYDERGLATRLDVVTGSGVLRLDLQYSFDEQGNPAGYSTLIMGLELRALVENCYEDGALRQAVITELLVEGKPLPPGENRTPAAYMLGTVLPLMLFAPLEHYVGYETCSLRLADSDREIRYENGQQVYSLSEQDSLRTETTTQALPEGGTRVTRRYQVTGERTSLSRKESMREEDGRHCLRFWEEVYPDDSRLTLTFRYEDGTNEEGQRTRLAFPDQITAKGGGTAETLAQNLRAGADQPFAEYLLDEKDRVSSYVIFNTRLDPEGKTTVWMSAAFDPRGRQISGETLLTGERNTIRTVTATEYR